MHALLAALVVSTCILSGTETGWTERETVWRGTDPVVSYRAKLDGDILIVEASHHEKWHTYAMDNPVRAKAAGGNPEMGLELPTEIQITGGLEVDGPWYQSPPKDFSDLEIRWYTWGFEGVSRFAAKVKRTGDSTAELVISAQACSDSSCRMVDRLEIEVSVHDATESDFDLDTLVPVKPAGDSDEGKS